tara:strand:+ start:322 stop:1428 length:1107 start_codon:yes stop_codon:yes gene_type:complete
MSKAAELANLIGNINAGGGGVNRNLIINGAMNVAQRGTSKTGFGGGSTSGYFTIDRFKLDQDSGGELTMTQDSSAPDGFANSLKLDCTTADTSVAAGEYLVISHRIEGQNLQAFKKGTSDAKPFAVSFYAKANASATYVVELYDADNNRQVSKSFTVGTDWARVELSFPADTTGAFDDDTAQSLNMQIWLHAGTTWSSGTLSETWTSLTNANRAVGISSFYDSTDRTFFLTGVQLELGQNPTSFEHEPVERTLAKCYRYFYAVLLKGGAAGYFLPAWMYAASTLVGVIRHPVEMRAAPTMETVDGTDDFTFYRNGAADNLNDFTLDSPSSTKSTGFYNTSDVSGTAGHAGGLYRNDTTNAFFYLKAEI